MYRAKATAALKEDLEHICIENIQVCILIGNSYFGDGDADAESLYFGTIICGTDLTAIRLF